MSNMNSAAKHAYKAREYERLAVVERERLLMAREGSDDLAIQTHLADAVICELMAEEEWVECIQAMLSTDGVSG